MTSPQPQALASPAGDDPVASPSSPAGGAVSRTLIDEFLADQAATTAVERFAAWHQDAAPRTARYRDLLPATPPGPDQQYAFDVDLDACSGCKACVVACSNLNGLDDGASFRSVGTLVAEAQTAADQGDTGAVAPVAASGCGTDAAPTAGGCGCASGGGCGTSSDGCGTSAGGCGTCTSAPPAAAAVDPTPVLRSVTTACHHCAEPGCLTGCPANAYEKDPVTGVVRHLDDQCIGCQYCTLTCPYEVPTYDADRGIVRKCDLCHDRLADGEAPACVQACPTDAIAIRTVDLDDLDLGADDGADWPFPAPSPATTTPTTRYRTREDLRSGVVAADAGAVDLAHAHPPLTVMLVLTQVAVGTLVALLATLPFLGTALADAIAPVAAATAFGTAVVALGASVLHLGRPLQAWRAVLGFGHSWLSREIVAFGVFAPLAAGAALSLAGMPPLADHAAWLAPAAAVAGLVGVGTSVMVYAVCGRRWWSWPRTAARFGATTLLGGLAVVLLGITTVAAATGIDATATVASLAAATTALAVAVAVAEVALLAHRHGPDDDELARTARLLTRRLPELMGLRMVLLAVGAVAMPWLSVVMLTVDRTSATAAAVTAALGLVAVLAGELLDRWRFFTASVPPRMPGTAGGRW